jgi:hypothetical protein
MDGRAEAQLAQPHGIDAQGRAEAQLVHNRTTSLHEGHTVQIRLLEIAEMLRTEQKPS